jgi:RES domain-containing protein
MTGKAVQLWRIATDAATYSAEDLTGEGAKRSGGRWNAVGTPLVYTATNRALACLETVVHIAGSAPALPLNRYLVQVDVPAALWRRAAALDPATLVGWDALPASKTSMDWGTAWANSRTQLLVLVPSVVVPDEMNVLINPLHPDIRKLSAKKVRRWLYDPRALGVPLP